MNTCKYVILPKLYFWWLLIFDHKSHLTFLLQAYQDLFPCDFSLIFSSPSSINLTRPSICIRKCVKSQIPLVTKLFNQVINNYISPKMHHMAKILFRKIPMSSKQNTPCSTCSHPSSTCGTQGLLTSIQTTMKKVC